MKDNNLLIKYAAGGVFVVVLIYAIGKYIVIGLVGVGAITIYRMMNPPNDRNRRR